LKQKVDAADGLVVFTSEYNRSVPAVTKSAIDWLSRVPGDSVLSRTTVGIVAATSGRHDASGVRTHLSSAVSANTQQLYGETLGIASISSKLADGQLTDEETRQQLAEWLDKFASYIAEKLSNPAAKNQRD
jgi:NAD(P)H-dependent FMN reductase